MAAIGNRAFDYLRYRFRSRSAFDLHSPFMFQLYESVLRDRRNYSEYAAVETLRSQLLREPGYITRTDFGARSSGTPWAKHFVHIRSIVRSSSVPPEYGRLLFRLARFFRLGNAVELGTSLGISSLYIALGHPGMNLITAEGCPNTADVARRNFAKLGLGNIDLRIGDFEDLLPAITRELPAVDFAFIDGNHREEATLRYFGMLAGLAGNDSVFVLDDIHWSPEMTSAWSGIRRHPKVKVTVDLYRMGLVFFREGLSRQDYVLRF